MRQHSPHLLLSATAALLLLAGCCYADEDPCHGHGVLRPDQKTCACTNDFPAPGSAGWTGPQCLIPVYGGVADGTDMAAACKDSGCAKLEPGGWACFAVHAAFNDSSWNYLAILLNRTSTDEKGDPDLFGMWAGGDRSAVPDMSARTFDFQDTSSASHPTITKLVSKADFPPAPGQLPNATLYDGAYLCVRSYGGDTPLEFALHATLTPCPAGFADDGSGAPMQCSTRSDAPEGKRRYSECSTEGECKCTGQYAKPVPAVFPGLGYEDCSTPTLNISREQLATERTVQLQDEAAMPDKWRQYSFEVGEGDGEVVVNIQLEEAQSRGSVDLYLKVEQPAGWGPRQYDLRPRWNAATRDSSLEVVLSPGMSQWRAGQWFAGVVGRDAPINYTITFSIFDCPGNCSSHGACQPSEGDPNKKECVCEEGYGGVDCSKATQVLEYGQAVNQTEATFEMHFYALPTPTEAMLSGNVELVVDASYSGGRFTHWLEAHPSVLLDRTHNNGTSYPTASSFAYKLSLDQPDTRYNLSLCPSQVRSGEWLLAVYNPLPTQALAYSLTVHKVGRCLHNCSEHGSCNSDGVCKCQPDWMGGDCSVSFNASCLAGSRRAAERPDDHGTCWQECQCKDTECSFTEECAGFSCQPGFRRQANASRCVQDECTKDVFSATAAVVCLKNCTCPADGASCTLAKECSVHIDINGGGRGHRGASGGTVFFWMLFSILLGGAGALGFIHLRGIPAWLPIRERGYGGPGLYNELSEHGI